MFRPIKTPFDITLVQEDLKRLQTWFKDNSMSFNVGKCHYMQFNRAKCPILGSYFLSNTELNRLHMKYLGVNRDPHLQFKDLYFLIYNKLNVTYMRNLS